MPFDLAFGFRHEPEARTVTEQSGERADGDRACVPERIQEARAGAELVQSVPAPGEVVTFLGRSPDQRRARFGQSRGQGLSVVEALGGDFPGVVDPHQPGDVAAKARIDRRNGRISGGWAAAGGAGEAGAEARVGEFQQAVEGGEDARVHATHII